MQGDPKGREGRTAHIHIYTSTHHTCDASPLTPWHTGDCIDIHTGPDGECVPPANTQRMLFLLEESTSMIPKKLQEPGLKGMGRGAGSRADPDALWWVHPLGRQTQVWPTASPGLTVCFT